VVGGDVPVKRLFRSRKQRMVGGVAGGIAEYLNADPTWIRLLWVVLGFAYGSGLLFYFAAWIIIPEEEQ